MTTSEAIGAIFAGLFGISLGSVTLYQIRRNTVHPFFRTWWAKYLEEPEFFHKLMCGICGAGIFLIGLTLLISGILALIGNA
jgi:hypothetical protein